MSSIFDKTWPNLMNARVLAMKVRKLLDSGRNDDALELGQHALTIAQHGNDLPLQDELRHLLRRARSHGEPG